MNHEIENLVDKLKEGSISRRGFMRRATALGVSAAAAGVLARSAAAQDATPMATPAGEVITSIPVEEAQKEYDEAFPWEEAENEGGDIIYAQSTDIATLNTVLSTDTYSALVSGLVYDFLIGSSVVNGRPIPTGLAESWEIAADGIAYTLHLRQGIKWHDGEPFTADDVIFTFDIVLAEDSPSVRKGTVDGVLDRYEKVDDYTVTFYAKAPSAIFLTEALGQFGIMPKHIWEGVAPADWSSDPGSTGTDPSRVIGTGGFKFVEWKLGESVTLEANKEYWDTPNIPRIDRFIYQVIADDNSAIAALQTGSADVAGISFSRADEIKQSNPDLKIEAYDTSAFNYYHCLQDETKETLFVDPRVRQAMLYALDRDAIAEAVYNNYAIRADGTQPVLSIAYAPDRVNTIYTYDPEKAKALLKEAGWEDTDGDGIVDKDGKKFSFEMFYSEGVATYETQIPFMQESYLAIGIEAIPAAVPFPTLLVNTDEEKYQMAVQGFSWSIDGGQDAMFASYMTPPNGFNSMRYKNDEYDALVEPSKTEIDVDKRIDILTEMSNIVNDDAAIGISVFRQDILGGAARLHNFFPNGYSNFHWLYRTWVDA